MKSASWSLLFELKTNALNETVAYFYYNDWTISFFIYLLFSPYHFFDPAWTRSSKINLIGIIP